MPLEKTSNASPHNESIPKKTSSAGPITGIVIIMLMLVLGALYFWGTELSKQNPNSPVFIPGDQVQRL